MNRLLPIGSVVYTLDKENMVVVVGYGGIGKKGIYDYVGLIYPYGFINKELIMLFNSSNVTKVLYEGMKTSEYEKAVSDIQKIIASAREENK